MKTIFKNSATQFSLGCLMLAAPACGDGAADSDAETNAESSDDETGTGGEPESALYGACAFIVGPEGLTGLVGTVDSIDSDGVFDASQAIEFPSGRPICASDGESLFVTDPGSPEMTKWVVEDGALVAAQTVSFANFGVGPLEGIQPQLIQFLSETRAYLVDVANRQVVIFDPSVMQTRGSIALDFEPPEGLTPSGARGILQAEDSLVVPFSLVDQLGVGVDSTIFAVIDTNTDEVSFATATGCGSIGGSQLTSSGALLFASNEAAAASHAAGLPGTFEPCLFDKDEGVPFDMASIIDLQALAGGDVAGGFAPGPGNTGFFLGYDESIAPLPTEQDPMALIVTEAWTLRRIADLDNATSSEPVLGVPAAGGRLQWTVVDGRTLVIAPAGDFSETVTYDVTKVDATTPAIEAITVPAILYSVFRLQ